MDGDSPWLSTYLGNIFLLIGFAIEINVFYYLPEENAYLIGILTPGVQNNLCYFVFAQVIVYCVRTLFRTPVPPTVHTRQPFFGITASNNTFTNIVMLPFPPLLRHCHFFLTINSIFLYNSFNFRFYQSFDITIIFISLLPLFCRIYPFCPPYLLLIFLDVVHMIREILSLF